MNISPKFVHFEGEHFSVGLADGRSIVVPLAWFPRLQQATPAQREKVELSPFGLHWEELNEDISVAGLLQGQADIRLQTSEPAH